MRFAWDIFRHYLLSRRAGSLIRTVAWLSISGVALGVMALVVVTSVMNGFNDQIRRRLLAAEPHLVITVAGLRTSEELLTLPVYKDLKARPGVTIEVFEKYELILRTVEGLFQGAIAKGVEPEALRYILRESARAQRINEQGRESTSEVFEETRVETTAELAANEVLVGIDLARVLGIFDGDKVVAIAPEAMLLPAGEAPPFERVDVRGFLRTNIQDIDSNMIYFSRGKAFQSFRSSPARELGFEVRMRNPEQVDELKQELTAKGFVTSTWIERNSALFYALKLEKLAMGVFLGLAALIASFSIVTVLVLVLHQKRKDIGLLMSMGLSPKATRWLFVKVGVLLSSIGIISGLLVGLSICWFVSRYPLTILPNIYYDSTIPARVDPRFIVAVLVIAAVISYLSADLPARAATQESPADALRSQRRKIGPAT